VAYIDYGGYAYRNGQRMVTRSDAILYPDGHIISSPGSYPGWIEEDRRRKQQGLITAHALLGGDGVFVALCKTCAVGFGIANNAMGEIVGALSKDDDQKNDQTITTFINGARVDVVYTEEDNFYVYARLRMITGDVWHGFSGYGVGCGLEACDYGFSTDDRVRKLAELFDDFPFKMPDLGRFNPVSAVLS
jgi:hypothetical protein